MNIVAGRGRNRRVIIQVPCAEIVKRSPKGEQKEASKLLCALLKVKASQKQENLPRD